MKIYLFDSLRDSIGTPKDWTFSDFYKYKISQCIQRDSKDSSSLFSFADYIDNKRQKSLVRAVSGLILDFDTVPSSRSAYDHEEFLDGYEWAWYRTFSYSEVEPRYRFIMPFKNPVPPSIYLQAAMSIYEMIGSPSGLDVSCVQAERFYYFPGMPDTDLYDCGYYSGEQMDVLQKFNLKEETDIYLSLKSLNTGETTKGRNNALKSQASACLSKQVPILQCVKELIEYDKANHSPPLFEDPSEFSNVNNPELNAVNFVSNIWRSHSRNHGETAVIFADKIPVAENVETSPVKKRKKFFTIPDKLALSAPGLVGDITRWISETAPYPQPALALGAALATVGVLKGHKVQGDTGLRTNLYCLGFASSGAGKNHPLTLCKLLLKECNLLNLYMGEPSSDGGLLTGIRDGGGKGLLLWDEFGEALGHMTGERAAAHYKRIMEEMTKLFSAANSFYAGRQRANSDGRSPRADFEQPCFCFYGVTNFRSFSDSVTEQHVRNGFLPRFLPFSAQHTKIGEFKKHQLVSSVPSHILEQALFISNMPESANGGNLERNPKIIAMEPAAEMLMEEIDKSYHEKRRLNQEMRGEEGDYLDSIWARGAEHVRKVALTVCNDDVITVKDLDWALEVVAICSEGMHEIALNEVGMTAFNRLCENAYTLILSKTLDGGIPRKDLYHAIKPRQNKKQMNEILDTLKDSGRIGEATPDGGRGVYFVALKGAN